MTDALRPLVPVPFAEAIAWAKARKVVLPDVYYGELQGLARSMAFSIAGLAKLDQLQAVLDSLVANLESGESFGKWQNRVASGEIPLDLPPHRLETIFRTNIQGHYGRGRCEQQKRTTDSHPWYLYDAVNDSRTRPSHAAMDGFMARHDDPVWAKWTPPSGYQSLLPDQPVSGAIEIGLKAWYSGPAVEIVMDSGARVRITAKHPVLTSAGWMDACDLRKGQDLLCYAGEVNDVGATVTSKAQEQHVPLTAEQAFNALSARGVVSVPRAAFNLNGDVEFIQSDVDVVTANRHLMNALQSGVREMIDKFDFKGANAGAVILPGSRSVFAHLFTPNRVIPKRAGIAGGYLRNFAHAFVAKVKNLGAYAIQFDPVRLQVSGQAFSVYVMGSGNGFEGFASQVTANDISRYRAAKLRSGDSGFPGSSNGGRLFSGTLAPSFRDVFVGGFGVNANAACDLIHAHSGLIKTDKVTDLRFFDWTGHVYDFQCSNGLIIAQGGAYNSHSPIISNCRCRRIALTEAQATRFIEADRKRLEKDPKLAEARAQAEPDKGWDYSPCAEPDAGLKRAWGQKVGKAHPALAEVAQQVMAQGIAPPAAWPLLQGSATTLDEIKRLGGERLQELLDLVTPDDRKLFPAMGDRGIRVEELMGRGGLSNEAAAWLRAEMMTRLKGVRQVGGQTFNLVNKSGKGVELAKRVASKLPDDWVENANTGYLVKVIVDESPRSSLGVYYKRYFDNNLKSNTARIKTTSGSTAEHEFIHHIQQMDFTLDGLFQQEHRLRTANDQLGPLPRYGSLGKPDKYIDEYFGREYEDGGANPNGGALEVITRAYQAILGDDMKANEWFVQMLSKDRAMLKLALGALFHYTP